jgi:hypothetical protein
LRENEGGEIYWERDGNEIREEEEEESHHCPSNLMDNMATRNNKNNS